MLNYVGEVGDDWELLMGVWSWLILTAVYTICDRHMLKTETATLLIIVQYLMRTIISLKHCVLLCIIRYTDIMSKIASLFKKRSSDDRDERESAMNISGPTNVTHDCHVGFDTEKGTFIGLPMAWAQWLQEANIR